MIDLNDRIIGDLLMPCQLPFPIFPDDLSNFNHSFDHEHMSIPKIVSGTIPILKQKRIIL